MSNFHLPLSIVQMLHPQEEAKTADKHFLQHDKFKDLAKKKLYPVHGNVHVYLYKLSIHPSKYLVKFKWAPGIGSSSNATLNWIKRRKWMGGKTTVLWLDSYKPQVNILPTCQLFKTFRYFGKYTHRWHVQYNVTVWHHKVQNEQMCLIIPFKLAVEGLCLPSY